MLGGWLVRSGCCPLSLLRTTESLLGISRHLGHAADPTTAGMRRAFHL
jgi:hypothetical protein